MRFPHYRFSVFLLIHGFALAVVGLFQDETKNIVLMILGGCFMMIFGAFKYWIAKQTDPDKVDLLNGMSSQSRKSK